MASRGQYRGKADRNRAAMQQLETKLREIATREASIRQEAYEMLEIVTNVVGELEDAGDDLVNEFGAYQMGRRTYQGEEAFIGRLDESGCHASFAAGPRRSSNSKRSLRNSKRCRPRSRTEPMGRLAEALRANLKSVAASDARALREMDQELKAATSGVVPAEAQLTGQVNAKSAAGQGQF